MAVLIGIGALLLVVVLHALSCSAVISGLKLLAAKVPIGTSAWSRACVLSLAASALALKHAADIFIWALVYWLLGAEQLKDLDNAIYFSAVTYTTLGYGDVVIKGRWRILSGFEAISGMFLFGLTTALLFLIFQRLFTAESEVHDRQTKSSPKSKP